MKGLRKQLGMGSLEWLVILFVGGILLSTGIKLVPIYIDNMAIKDAFKTIYSAQNPAKSKPRAADIAELINKKLVTNNIHYLSKDNIAIDYSSGSDMQLNLKYDVRIDVVGNIDAIVSFDHVFFYPKK